MSLDHDFKAELGAQLRSRYPKCTSALIVGSYAFGRPFIDDIDVAAFDESLPNEKEVIEQTTVKGWKIDIALRNPSFMDPGRAERDNILLLLREMRKVVAGIVLFDDAGLLERTIPWWSRFDIPLRLIAPFYDRVCRLDLGSMEGAAQRLSFYYGIENMVIGWLHSEMRFRFSKPKWLLWDLEQLQSKPFEMLLRSISTELCELADPGELIARFRDALPASAEDMARSDIKFCKIMLKDAAYMVDRGEKHAAVWPLRTGAFHLAMWTAGQMQLAYRDVRSIGPLLEELARTDPTKHDVLSSVLLASTPVPRDFVELFEASRRDFGRCLEQKRGPFAAPPSPGAPLSR